MKISTSKTYGDIDGSSKRYTLCQGGSRSAKTYSICQWLILQMVTSTVSIRAFRKFSATHSETSLRTFRDVLLTMGIPFKVRSNTEYTIGKSYLVFLGADDPEKLKGGESDITWINEANGLSKEDFDQIAMRTKHRLIMDFNPSMKNHWLYKLEEDHPDDTVIFYSTFRNNPFLGEAQRKQILSYRQLNPAKWRIYGLGLRATAEETVYPIWDMFVDWPLRMKQRVFGLDFGWKDKMALVEVGILEGEIYVKEHIYAQELGTSELIKKMTTLVGNCIIYCDSAAPDKIRELQNAGLNATKSIKSVEAGINFVQDHKIYLYKQSINLQNEMSGYSYQRHKGTGELLDKVIDGNDHLLDAMRYAAYTHWGQAKQGSQFNHINLTPAGRQDDSSNIGYHPDF